MEILEAVEILEAHNHWRRGGEGNMGDTIALGIAIDTVTKEMRRILAEKEAEEEKKKKETMARINLQNIYSRYA